MKKKYEVMEAFKINFDSKEQVMALACIATDKGTRYDVDPVGMVCFLNPADNWFYPTQEYKQPGIRSRKDHVLSSLQYAG